MLEPLDDYTPEEYERWEWDWDYYEAIRLVEEVAMFRIMSKCPICNKSCGEPDYMEGDPSVGHSFGQWDNTCYNHGDFFCIDDGRGKVWVWDEF